MSNVKSLIHNLKLIIKGKSIFLFFFLFLLLFIYLFLNILFSQNISTLFFGVIDNQKQAAVDYLKKIKLLPQFNKELEYYIQIFGKEIGDEVFRDEKKRKEKITELEQLLTKNDRARDVLYGLYLLYKEDENNLKAEKYLMRVKEIDPNVK